QPYRADLALGFEICDRLGLFRIGHARISADHVDFPVDKSAGAGLILGRLGGLASKLLAQVRDWGVLACPLRLLLLDPRGWRRRRVRRHGLLHDLRVALNSSLQTRSWGRGTPIGSPNCRPAMRNLPRRAAPSCPTYRNCRR